MDILTPKEQFLLLGIVLSLIAGSAAQQWRPRPVVVTAEAAN